MQAEPQPKFPGPSGQVSGLVAQPLVEAAKTRRRCIVYAHAPSCLIFASISSIVTLQRPIFNWQMRFSTRKSCRTMNRRAESTQYTLRIAQNICLLCTSNVNLVYFAEKNL